MKSGPTQTGENDWALFDLVILINHVFLGFI